MKYPKKGANYLSYKVRKIIKKKRSQYTLNSI